MTSSLIHPVVEILLHASTSSGCQKLWNSSLRDRLLFTSESRLSILGWRRWLIQPTDESFVAREVFFLGTRMIFNVWRGMVKYTEQQWRLKVLLCDQLFRHHRLAGWRKNLDGERKNHVRRAQNEIVWHHRIKCFSYCHTIIIERVECAFECLVWMNNSFEKAQNCNTLHIGECHESQESASRIPMAWPDTEENTMLGHLTQKSAEMKT
jgi:hypothetical protein